MDLLASQAVRVECTSAADAQEVIVVILTRTFPARTHTLSQSQEELWKTLGDQLPDHWVLYGDTALGLRMGHRRSLNFEFKSSQDLNPRDLRDDVPFLREAQVLESDCNHLKVAVGGRTPVEMVFDGGQTIKQVFPPERANNGLAVASLADLAAEKMYKVSQQATVEHCRDVATLLYEGTTIDEMLGCAKAVYGEEFRPPAAIWNLTGIDHSEVRLDRETESMLIKEGAQGRLPARTPVNAERITTESREPTLKMTPRHNFERAVDPYDLRDPFDWGPER